MLSNIGAKVAFQVGFADNFSLLPHSIVQIMRHFYDNYQKQQLFGKVGHYFCCNNICSKIASGHSLLIRVEHISPNKAAITGSLLISNFANKWPPAFVTVLFQNGRYKDVIGFWDVLFRSNAEGDFFFRILECGFWNAEWAHHLGFCLVFSFGGLDISFLHLPRQVRCLHFKRVLQC